MKKLTATKMFMAACLATATVPVSAASFVYSDFSSTSGLTVNGDAATINTGARTVMRVTPSQFFKSGSVFSSSAIEFGPTYGFSTRFTFNLNAQQGGGADGLVFVIQPNSNSVGGSGGGIGYGGIGKSLGVEYDTFNNGVVDQGSSNHIGIDLNGSLTSLAQNNALPFILDSGRDLTSWIDYDGTTKTIEVRLSNNNIRPLSAILTYNFDLAAVVGSSSAFVGFTSGTGGGSANHDLVNWEFRDSFSPIGSNAVPEPSTWAMMILGFAFVGGSLRTSRRRSLVVLGR